MKEDQNVTFLNDVGEKMIALDREVQDLRNQFQTKVEKDLPKEIDEMVDQFETKKDRIAGLLKNAKEYRGENWNDVKLGLDSAVQNLQVAFDRIKNRINSAA